MTLRRISDRLWINSTSVAFVTGEDHVAAKSCNVYFRNEEAPLRAHGLSAEELTLVLNGEVVVY